MSTEEKILHAAREEFLTNGFEGARMRGIAEQAEINKGLLHYYFKSKEALLIKVFQSTFQSIFINLAEIFNSDLPLFDQIEQAVASYTDFMLEHPRLPQFIISEMNRDPQKHMMRMKKAEAKPPFHSLVKSISEAKSEGLVRSDYNPKMFMLNMMSLILFSFIAKPMVMFMHGASEKEYKQMLQQRKTEVARLLIKDLKAQN